MDSIRLGVVDYIIFASIIAVSISIGIFHACTGNKQSTTMEYHLGDRMMKPVPTAMSMFVTLQSSLLVIGTPAEVYMYGGVVIWTGVAFMISHLVVVRIFVPMIYPLKLTTVNEYFQLRYNSRATRLYMAFCMVLVDVVYISIIVYGQAVAMEKVTGIQLWVSVVTIISAAILYTSIGGLKAVIWTDVFQCLVMLFGMMSIIVKGTMDSGGVYEVFRVNKQSGRLNLLEVSLDPHIQYTIWSQCIGGGVKFLYALIRQPSAQRINACPTENDAVKVFYIAGPLFIVSFTLATLEGLITFAYFARKGCDPIRSRQIKNPNQIFPYMVVQIFEDYPGFSGIFLASVTCANLSSISSSLASLSSITCGDLLKPYFPNMSDYKATRLSKYAVVAFGTLSIIGCFGFAKTKVTIIRILLNAMAVIGMPIVSVYLYSVFVRSARQLNLFLALLVSTAAILWISMGQLLNPHIWKPSLPRPGPVDDCPSQNMSLQYHANVTSTIKHTIKPVGLDALYSLSTYWFDIIGIACFFVVVAIVHCVRQLTGCNEASNDIDDRLVFSFRMKSCCCFRKRYPQFLQVNASDDKTPSNERHDNLNTLNMDEI